MRTLLIALAMLSFVGCTAETSDPEVSASPAMSAVDARAAIGAQNLEFKAKFEAKDAQGLAGLYTEDGMIIPPDAPNAVGREAIAAYWVHVTELFASATITTEEVYPVGRDQVLERSSVLIYNADGKQVGNAKAMILWVHENGALKMHRDIWNYGE